MLPFSAGTRGAPGILGVQGVVPAAAVSVVEDIIRQADRLKQVVADVEQALLRGVGAQVHVVVVVFDVGKSLVVVCDVGVGSVVVVV